MDTVCGKTFRKVPSFSHGDGELSIRSNSQLEIFGNEFSNAVSYSVKKRKRWELIPSISRKINLKGEREYYEDIPIRCCIRQEYGNRGSTRAHYLIDSNLQKEIGSMNLSDRKFNKESFNLGSVIQCWEQQTGLLDKEVHSNNINWAFVAEKLLEKNFSSKDSFVSKFNDELSKKNEIALNSVENKHQIWIEQVVPVNTPYSTKPRIWHSERWRKRPPKKWDFDDFSVNQGNLDGYYLTDDEEYDMVTTESINDKVLTLPVVSNEEVFINTSKTYQSKRRKRKNQKNRKNRKYPNIINRKFENIQMLPTKASELPNILITLSRELFMEELKNISGFCHRWRSLTSPEMILIDVDYLSNLLHKNFIVLKPVSINSDDLLTINVIFNLFNYDFSKITGKDFLSVLEMVTFIQSTIDQIENFERSDKVQNMLSLSNPVENLFNTWNTKIINTTKSFFCFNDEWKKYEFHQDEINLQSLPSNLQENISVCEICDNHFDEEKVFLLKECQHRICDKCFTNHLMDLLKSNRFSFDCPITDCHSTVDCVSVLSLIPFEEYQKIVECLESSIIKTKTCCQCFSCKSVLIKSDVSVDLTKKKFDYSCRCGIIICGFCGNKQHWPSSCDDIVQHNNMLVKLNESFNIQLPKPGKVEGKFCPSCYRFHVENPSVTRVMCPCGKWFCYNCGQDNCKSYFESICQNDNRRLVFKVDIVKQTDLPEPNSFLSRFYCESFKVKSWLQQSNYTSVKLRLKQIDQRLKNTENFHFDIDKIISQYQQILKVIESIFVFQYLSIEKNSTKCQILKKAVQNLMLFVNEFRAIIDQLDEGTNKKSKTQISSKEMLKKREKVDVYMNNAMNVVKKCQNFIH